MFEYINIVAVIGTSCFMVAVAMIWYSPYLFQSTWLRAVRLDVSDIERDPKYNQRLFVLTALSYLVVVYILALVIGYAQVFGIAVQHIAVIMSVWFAALLAGFTLWERRSLSYYVITVGFSTVFISGSIFLLYYWPW